MCGLDRERQPERERDKGRVAGERETAREIERERETQLNALKGDVISKVTKLKK